jgi:hypothetical protein
VAAATANNIKPNDLFEIDAIAHRPLSNVADLFRPPRNGNYAPNSFTLLPFCSFADGDYCK